MAWNSSSIQRMGEAFKTLLLYTTETTIFHSKYLFFLIDWLLFNSEQCFSYIQKWDKFKIKSWTVKNKSNHNNHSSLQQPQQPLLPPATTTTPSSSNHNNHSSLQQPQQPLLPPANLTLPNIDLIITEDHGKLNKQ